jgi:ABC-2 type transport system ATP-binding protein
MTASVVAVRGLVKRYAEVTAVDGLSLDIAAGEVYGLLGENGAGKSTTIEILEGHRHATAGDVSVLGVDPRRADAAFYDRIGIVLQSSGIERVLTVREVLTMYAPSYGRPRSVDECVDLVGLGAFVDQRIEKLSGGQRRRVDLALGIIGHPELLFLDEPTTGLDPAARRASWELIRTLSAEGTTIILTSHYLDEVEQLAGRVGVMVRGRLVVEGTPETLASAAGVTTVRFPLPDGVAPDELAFLGAALAVDGGQVTVSTPTPTATLHGLTGWALERGHDLAGLTVSRPSLEDMFLEVTAGSEAGDG